MSSGTIPLLLNIEGQTTAEANSQCDLWPTRQHSIWSADTAPQNTFVEGPPRMVKHPYLDSKETAGPS